MKRDLYVVGTSKNKVARAAYQIVENGETVRTYGLAVDHSTPYRMTLFAMVEGLKSISKGSVTIHVANESLLKTGRDWIEGWRRRGWRKKGGAIRNLDLVQALAAQRDRLEVQWVSFDKAGPFYDSVREVALGTSPTASPPAGAVRPEPPEPEPCAQRLVAYTDGGCRGNPGGLGAWGVLLIDVPSGRALEGRGSHGETTNNRMEVQAAIEALSAVKRDGSAIEMRTDSKYLKDMAESWLPGWKRRGWRKADGDPVQNRDLVERLDVQLRRLKVVWRWVPGHSGEPGNEYVDALANAAMDAFEGKAESSWVRHPVSPVVVRAASSGSPG